MHIILGIILVFFLIVFLIGASLVRQVYKLLFGGFGRKRDSEKYSDNNTYSDHNNTYNDQSHRRGKEKIFSKDEGEYIDFEEIKDDDNGTR